MTYRTHLKSAAITAILAGGTALPVQADIVHPDDVIIQGSACIGFDCINNENFGFDTVRIKENNTRLQFNDTSSGSFPTNNWQIRANSSSSGGPNFLGFVDQGATGESETGTIVFSVAANAGANALFVNAGGNVGFGNASPVVKLHATNGNTPTLRLEQNGTSGFSPQTWDLAGNEANFFLRDVTNASRLVFRVQPNAPSNSIFVAASGNVGMGTSSPGASLHVVRTAAGTTELLRLSNNGAVFSGYEDTSVAAGDNTGRIWNVQNVGGEFRVTTAPGGPNEVELAMNAAGDLKVTGNFISGTTTLNVPDYVFAEDYRLMPLAEVEKFIVDNRHLPDIPSAADMAEKGLNISEIQLALLKKVEELTLYTLGQQKSIDALQARLEPQAD